MNNKPKVASKAIMLTALVVGWCQYIYHAVAVHKKNEQPLLSVQFRCYLKLHKQIIIREGVHSSAQHQLTTSLCTTFCLKHFFSEVGEMIKNFKLLAFGLRKKR